jgi:hypothetical protein
MALGAGGIAIAILMASQTVFRGNINPTQFVKILVHFLVMPLQESSNVVTIKLFHSTPFCLTLPLNSSRTTAITLFLILAIQEKITRDKQTQG